MVKNINQYQRTSMDPLNKKVQRIRTGMLNTPSLEKWSEDIDCSITLVLVLLEKL